MISVTNLRSGTFFEEKGTPFEVLKYTHTKLAKRMANIKVKVHNLKTGSIVEKTFLSGSKVEPAELERKEAQFLYKDKGNYYFMDVVTFDQSSIPKKILGERAKFLKEGGEVRILFYNGEPLNIELPLHLEFKVKDAPPGVRGDTAVNIFKEVVLENGIVVKAPLFIKVGDKIVVDTRRGEYVKKLKTQNSKRDFRPRDSRGRKLAMKIASNSKL